MERKAKLVMRFEAHIDSANEKICGIGCPHLSARHCNKFGRLARSPDGYIRHWTCRSSEPEPTSIADLESRRLEQIASVPAVIEWTDGGEGSGRED